MGRDWDFIRYVIEDRKRLTPMNIRRLVKWLKRDDGSSNLGNFQFIHDGKRLGLCSNSQDSFNTANEMITRLDGIIVQDKQTGMTLDYAHMDIGEITRSGEQIRKCSFCGRPGVVYDDPKYFKSTTHKVYIHSGMCAEVLDSCDADKRRQAIDKNPHIK